MLDRRTFRLTESGLERRFLPLVGAAGLAGPAHRQWVNGFEVDFYWPDLGFVVETDGLRYHRTPAQQARDRLRDQAHTAAGLTPAPLHPEQVRYEPEHVLAILATRDSARAAPSRRALSAISFGPWPSCRSSVRIREVGPRDGFQNEPETIATADKVRLIDMLSATGLKRLEVTSFVRPDVIPQLADAERGAGRRSSAARASPSRS